MRRCWQRACACLTRLALQQGLRTYWEQVDASVLSRCPTRHQLLALPVYADVSTARLARTAWHGLSRAMHHHVYELAPTHAELRAWHRDVAALLDELKHRVGSASSS
ncbi:hypothetical protein [Micromonospora sp. CP22]|uniref:hypothetical protein n=1 Tax=Micromonospora sp. CP22 TaxID=2580517 RepID=UPI0012BD00D0|nr:hypothetical protein [Micromonospora sp. CP22]MTK04236.1 hypothetical protein [Micromonospora sp. CP22]